MGDGIYYVTAALYFTRIVHLSPLALSGGLTLAWAVGLTVSVPVGRLADLWGPRRIAIGLLLGAGVAVSAYLVIRSWSLFVLAACAYTICQRGSMSAQQALLRALVDKDALVKTRAYIQVTYNFGLAVGAAIGGAALLAGTPAAYLTAFAVDGASFVAAAVVLTRIPDPGPRAGTGDGRRFEVFGDRPYMLLVAINTVLVMHLPLIDVALPLWVVRHTTAPRWTVAAIFLVNTLLVVVMQVRLSRGVTDLASAGRQVRLAGFVLLGACLVFAAAAAASWAWLAACILLAAAALQSVGEMLQFPGTWQISFGLAPEGRQGEYQAFWGNGLTIAGMIGPVALTGLLVYWGVPGWITLGCGFGIAGTVMGPAVRWAERERERRQAAVVAAEPALGGRAEVAP